MLGRAGLKPHLVLAAAATGLAVDDLSLRLGEDRCSALEAFSHWDQWPTGPDCWPGIADMELQRLDQNSAIKLGNFGNTFATSGFG